MPFLRNGWTGSTNFYCMAFVFKLILITLIDRLPKETGTRSHTDISIPRRLAFCAAVTLRHLQIAQRSLSIVLRRLGNSALHYELTKEAVNLM